MLSYDTEAEFRGAFPEAALYQKANDPRFPVFAIPLIGPTIAVNKSWGPGGSTIPVDCHYDTHVLLVNTAIGEVYPCAKTSRTNGTPVGYIPSDTQPCASLTAYDSEPIWAAQVFEPTLIKTLEGVTEVPPGAWLCFSDTKNLYYVTGAKWDLMGFERLDG